MKSQQSTSSIQSVSPSTTLFKIFASLTFTFEKAFAESKVDWSGFYTQLTPEHSMRYLTKKWGDGAEYGCLVKIGVKNDELRLMKVKNECLGNGKVSGEEKANIIKEHLHKDKGIQIKGHLLQQLGKKKILLECVDAEDLEVIIPHNLLNENNFTFQTVLGFRRSNDGMLRTTGWKRVKDEEENYEIGWEGVQGDAQFEPYLLLEVQKVRMELNG